MSDSNTYNAVNGLNPVKKVGNQLLSKMTDDLIEKRLDDIEERLSIARVGSLSGHRLTQRHITFLAWMLGIIFTVAAASFVMTAVVLKYADESASLCATIDERTTMNGTATDQFMTMLLSVSDDGAEIMMSIDGGRPIRLAMSTRDPGMKIEIRRDGTMIVR